MRRLRGSPAHRAILLALLALPLTHACNGGKDGTSPGETPYLTGTYVGDYTASVEPGTVYRAGLTLLQTGRNLRGQLSTDGLRTALVSFTIDGSTLAGELEYTDDCSGSAQVTADIQAAGDRIVGSYSASDCGGEYTGTFDVVRRTGLRSPPTVAIIAPADGSTFVEGDTITFEGEGADPDGGSVVLGWRSNRQGVLGFGSSIHIDELSPGEHTISLTAIDDEVQVRATSVTITISDYLTGTFVGEYTVSTEPDTVYPAALVLSQAGRDVCGEFTTAALRTGLVSFVTDGLTLTGGLEFTDDCAGSASVTANIEDGGDRIVGSYSASDCSGEYTGTLDMVKSTGRQSRPTVTILEPQGGSVFLEYSTIAFRGTGYDPDGGSVTLLWRSSLDGDLGKGSPIYRDDLSIGTHAIELIGIDDEVQFSAVSSVSIDIEESSGSFALQFAGSQSTVTADADDLDLTTDFTIEMWIRPLNEGLGPAQHLLSKWGSVSNAAYYMAIAGGHSTDRTLELGTRDSPGGSNTVVQGNVPLQNDIWQHVAAVFDNGEVRLYVDGQLDTVQTGPHVPQVTSQAVSLGRERSRNPNWYSGLVDEVRIWNVARTAAEIAATMNVSLTGSEPGLVAYWQLDEGGGDTAYDRTGNGHHMQLGEFAGPDNADPTWVTPGKLRVPHSRHPADAHGSPTPQRDPI